MTDIFSGIGQQVLGLLLPALATAIAGLLVGILTRYLKKIGLEVDAKQEARLKEIAVKAVTAVEERARREKIASGEAMSSRAKDATAAAIVSAQLPKLNTAEVNNAIDAALPEVRKNLGPIIMVPVPSTPATFGRQP